MSSTVWRFHHMLTIGRLFVGVSAAPWKARHLRKSNTVGTYSPGHQRLSRSGPSLAIKIPPLPFEIVVGIWKAFRENIFADTPGVEALSVQAPGEISDQAVPISEYHVEKDAHPPTFVVMDGPMTSVMPASVRHWPSA